MGRIGTFIILSLASFTLAAQPNKAVLQKVLQNLNKVSSASYHMEESASAPYDTVMFGTYMRYLKESVNQKDTTIGSSMAWFDVMDTSKMTFFYDGNRRGYLDHKDKTMDVDSFKLDRRSFRAIGPPFFNYTRSIIEYSLITKDTISISMKDFDDYIQFTLQVPGKVIEFFGHDIAYIDLKYIMSSATDSRYDIWISKADYLPFRLKRTMPHQTSWQTISDVEFNQHDNFSPASDIPPNFSFKKRRETFDPVLELEGRPAPPWILKSTNNTMVELNALTSKVIMIQFTGIGCGPCHMSVPFLKQLTNEFDRKSFELISIETWSSNMDGIRRYSQKNSLPYKFLQSEASVTEAYKANFVPLFFILDEKRIIRKIISGYSSEATDKEIRTAVRKLL